MQLISNTIGLLSILAGVGIGALAYENRTIEKLIDELGFMGHFFVVFLGMCGAGIAYIIMIGILNLFC